MNLHSFKSLFICVSKQNGNTYLWKGKDNKAVLFIVLQERDTEREIHRKSPAGDTGLNTKYIIVIESKHKQFAFMKKHTCQITFSIRTIDLCMCQLLSL